MEPMPDVAVRFIAEPAVGAHELEAEDLEAIENAIHNPASALLSDRLLMVMQNMLKSVDKKELAALLGDLRAITWFSLSTRSLHARGVLATPQNLRDSLQKCKAVVDSINDVSTVVWAPISLINKYGLAHLANLASSCGAGVDDKAIDLIAKTALRSVSLGRFELDALQKGLAFAIAARKGVFSSDFARSTLEVGRIASSLLGYNQTSFALGMFSASIGAWQIWKSLTR